MGNYILRFDKRVMLSHAIDVIMYKERCRQENRKRLRPYGPETIDIISEILIKLDLIGGSKSIVRHMTSERLIMLEEAKERARELYRAFRMAKARAKEYYRAYRKAKTAVRNLLRIYWIERVRFASRAIGNMWDYSLEMVAIPPTMASVDEYFHQRGGAMVGCTA